MKSKISLVHKGVSRNLLKRYWPLWAVYFAALLLITPVRLSGMTGRLAEGEMLNYTLLVSGIHAVKLSMAAGVLAAMAMYNYLYTAKSCGLMNTLPLRRETMFLTAFLTGLLPLLAADVLVMLMTGALFGGRLVYFRCLLQWLAMAVMGNVGFYGFAVLCAVLTGNIVVMPALYAVLNCTVFVAESCVRELLSCFVYGMTSGYPKLTAFSPLVNILENVVWVDAERYVDADGVVQVIYNSYKVEGMGILGAYCAAGLACAVLALLLYRRRKMECAGDVVAVPVLRPVFQYCMAFGSAAVFATLVYRWFVRGSNGFGGVENALLLLLLMLIGAFLGYFAAEMLMQKTVKVFSGKWKGYLITCLMLTALTMACEFDLFGYERWLPKAEDVALVSIYEGDIELREQENILKAIELHQSIVKNKARNEGAEESYTVNTVYTMKDGSKVKRSFPIAFDPAAQEDPSSDINRLQELCNLQEAINKRAEIDFAVTGPGNISIATIEAEYYEEKENTYYSLSTELTDEQAYALYTMCAKDIEAGTLGRQWIVHGEEYLDTVTNVTISFAFVTRQAPLVGEAYDYATLTLCTDAENCMRWIAENTDIEILTQRQLQAMEPAGDAPAAATYSRR